MAITAVLRPAIEADGPALSELEHLAFQTPNWPAATFLRFECTIAEVDGQIAGFLVARQIFAGNASSPPEREILNLAVAPAYRRSGLASQLLQQELCRQAILFLEVRASNFAALSLYQRFGFIEVLRRTDYYDNPPESAIVMRFPPANANRDTAEQNGSNSR